MTRWSSLLRRSNIRRQATVQSTSSIVHQLGTRAMRPRAESSVVDPRLNLYGVQVVDMSIALLAVGANTYHTAILIGEKAVILRSYAFSRSEFVGTSVLDPGFGTLLTGISRARAHDDTYLSHERSRTTDNGGRRIMSQFGIRRDADSDFRQSLKANSSMGTRARGLRFELLMGAFKDGLAEGRRLTSIALASFTRTPPMHRPRSVSTAQEEQESRTG
ncbi:hypothetical protein C8R46DRAFT_1040765 [Mycena filopes]|nr:hypothetical protein C8R46DRAFT_1040765 [Mycena filopes]